MVTLNVSLPESMKTFIEAQTSAGGYRGPSEYVQFLIREAQKAHELALLEAKLLEGIEALDGGEGCEMTVEDWKRLRGNLLTQHGQGAEQ